MMNPRIYDALMRPLEAAGLARLRERYLAGLRGRVLLVGAGSGVDLPRFGAETRVVALDLDERMLARARQRSPVQAVRADAQSLPFASGSFDVAVFSLVLCSVLEPRRAVAEAARVLRSGGTLVTVEHVLAPGRVLAAAQRSLTPVWKRFAGGCHLDRETEALLGEAGFHPRLRTRRWRGILVGAEWRRG